MLEIKAVRMSKSARMCFVAKGVRLAVENKSCIFA